jgi:ribonuclease HI
LRQQKKADAGNVTRWMAVENACLRLLETGVTDANVTVYTDSEFCLRHFDQARLLAAGARRVTMTHSPAHKGARSMVALYNGRVDRLAKSAMRALRDRA